MPPFNFTLRNFGSNLLHGEEPARPADVGDAPVTGREIAALHVVGEDLGNVGTGDVLVDEHEKTMKHELAALGVKAG